MKRLLIGLAVVAACVGPARAANLPAGLSLTLEASSTVFSAGVPLPLSGRLLVYAHAAYVEQSVPLPAQGVDLLVDGATAKTVTTNNDGAFSTTLTFDLSKASHRIQAVAYQGLPIETRSAEITVTIDRFIIGLDISPSSATIRVGETVRLHALATYDDGRQSDISEQAAWSSSDTNVAGVSNGAGSRGVVSGVGLGSATISATALGFTATARISVTA